MPELFDVVDDDDKPTGKLVTKKDAHMNGDLHRLVAVYAFTPDGKLLMQNHRLSGMWDHSVGGHVSSGEDYAAAVLREAAEELGLQEQVLEEVFTGLYSDEVFDAIVQRDIQMHYFSVYECRLDDLWKFMPNEEVNEIVAWELSEIIKQMHEHPGKFTPGFINTMAKYLEVKGLPHEFDHDHIRANWGASRQSLQK